MLEVAELVSVVEELALVDDVLLACNSCMRIERPDPPTPLTDMMNSRTKGVGREFAPSAAVRGPITDVFGSLNGRAAAIRRTFGGETIGK